MGLIFSDGITKDIEVIGKEQEYIKYIVEHINNVNTAYNELFKGRTFDPIEIEFDDKTSMSLDPLFMDGVIKQLELEIKAHDLSKFSNEEFPAYRMRFFPTDTEKKQMEADSDYVASVEASFQEAWEHHYHENKHHANYWMYEYEDGEYKLLDTPYIMPVVDILHMICDWSAMSIKFQHTNSPVEWYINDADKEKGYMHPNTKKLVEYFLSLIFDAKL